MSQRVIAIFAAAIMLTASAASASAKSRSAQNHSGSVPVCNTYSDGVVQSAKAARSCDPNANLGWSPAPIIMRDENVPHNR
jgi:hypothetical protein